MDDVSKYSTRDLLAELIGKQNALTLYTDTLRELFNISEGCNGYRGRREMRARRKLAVAREIVARSLAEEIPTREIFTDPALVRNYLRLVFAPLEHEVFACMFLDTRNYLIRFEVMFQGTLDSATVHPREIAKLALRLNAGAVILAHNHPSGISEPSQADRLLTRRIADALALFEVRVLDHFVMGEDSGVSFAERGWL